MWFPQFVLEIMCGTYLLFYWWNPSLFNFTFVQQSVYWVENYFMKRAMISWSLRSTAINGVKFLSMQKGCKNAMELLLSVSVKNKCVQSYTKWYLKTYHLLNTTHLYKYLYINLNSTYTSSLICIIWQMIMITVPTWSGFHHFHQCPDVAGMIDRNERDKQQPLHQQRPTQLQTNRWRCSMIALS